MLLELCNIISQSLNINESNLMTYIRNIRYTRHITDLFYLVKLLRYMYRQYQNSPAV